MFPCACAAAFKQLCPYGHGAVPGRGEGRVGKTRTYNKLHNTHTCVEMRTRNNKAKSNLPFKWLKLETLTKCNLKIKWMWKLTSNCTLGSENVVQYDTPCSFSQIWMSVWITPVKTAPASTRMAPSVVNVPSATTWITLESNAWVSFYTQTNSNTQT